MSALQTALVVGADAAGRAPVAGLLRLTGWDVREAAGTREALGLARRLELDLVVVDLDVRVQQFALAHGLIPGACGS